MTAENKRAIGKTLASFLSIGLTLALIELRPTMPVRAIEPPVQGPNFNAPDLHKAFFDASRIYGKKGCGDVELADMTARNALRTGLPANLIAAVVGVESSCNPLAISKKGAVGIMQVNVAVWSEKYGNFRTINPFNPEEGMRVGCDILSANVKQYGLRSGVAHYDGVGPEADEYGAQVLALAGVK
jgi:soluble lytic murein transglycosylase-like protein